MDHRECRTLILNRLQVRDRQSDQFDRIIRSYQSLANSMRHLINRKNFASHSFRKSQTSLPQESSLELEEQIAKLEAKYEEICLQKGVNDQQLIEKTNRLVQVEKELGNTKTERDNALATIELYKKDLARIKEEMAQLKQDNRTLFDEHIALQAAYSAVEENFIRADKERAELIGRMKELKEREITLVNEMNEREQQLSLQKLQCDLAEASKPNPVLDAKAFCSVLNIHDSFEVLAADEKTMADTSGDSTVGQERLQSFGDIIPDRCKIKFECNEIGDVNDLRFHPNGKFFFTAGIDKKIKMWEPRNDNCVKRLEFTGANQGLTRIDIHLESGHLLGSSNDSAVRLWSIDDQRMRIAFTGHTDKVTSAKFMCDGRQVVSGSNDRTIKIWDTITNRCQKTFFPASTICDLVTNDNYGAPLISAHFDKNIRFWDTRAPSDSPINMIKFDAKMTSLCLTSDYMYLLCSSRDETLTLLDLRTNDTLHIYSAEQYRTSSDYSRAAVISPDVDELNILRNERHCSDENIKRWPNFAKATLHCYKRFRYNKCPYSLFSIRKSFGIYVYEHGEHNHVLEEQLRKSSILTEIELSKELLPQQNEQKDYNDFEEEIPQIITREFTRGSNYFKLDYTFLKTVKDDEELKILRFEKNCKIENIRRYPNFRSITLNCFYRFNKNINCPYGLFAIRKSFGINIYEHGEHNHEFKG
ncbi:hypothetical protein Mgra_00008062 [Meloidogyne graminicola]|uniref:Autophagy-related protein 16 domain-containing protein n=1 Tax=Meloidogyne graminicola TaxID=189291 RepID=A0A8S9ZGW6_9BILA|nr:hypothetical protein Mgra_00008062 [Meloidogyne graminicola]